LQVYVLIRILSFCRNGKFS